MGHRRRVGRMPAGVPFLIWDADKSLDEFVYTASLSDEEIAALPLEREFWEFYRSVDGEALSLPDSFVWDEERNLVDLQRYSVVAMAMSEGMRLYGYEWLGDTLG